MRTDPKSVFCTKNSRKKSKPKLISTEFKATTTCAKPWLGFLAACCCCCCCSNAQQISRLLEKKKGIPRFKTQNHVFKAILAKAEKRPCDCCFEGSQFKLSFFIGLLLQTVILPSVPLSFDGEFLLDGLHQSYQLE